MAAEKTIDNYLEKKSQWKNELLTLKKLVEVHELKEAIKWGAPVYSYKGKNIVGLSAFKRYVGLWFFQGGLLKDKSKKLVNAQEGKTHAMRQWRFESLDEIKANSDHIHSYIKEAIANQKAGKEIKAKKGQSLIIPQELLNHLESDLELKNSFETLNLSRKREFAEYITLAKQEKTKIQRLKKITPMIIGRIGLNDKYK